MRIIFLDIDGVLTTRRTKYHKADPVCVSELNRVVRTTNAFIVVTSTWRRMGVIRLNRLFNEWGVKVFLAGVTPDLSRMDRDIAIAAQRGLEIQEWIREMDEVPSFVILDDDSDMGALSDRLVRTDSELGLNPRAANQAISMLLHSL